MLLRQQCVGEPEGQELGVGPRPVQLRGKLGSQQRRRPGRRCQIIDVAEDLGERVIPFQIQMLGNRPHGCLIQPSRPTGQAPPGQEQVPRRSRVLGCRTEKMGVAQSAFFLPATE